MMKKLIGILVAVAVIAVIVIVFLRRDKFESMIRRDELPAASAPAVPAPVQPVVPVADSLTLGGADSI